MLARLFAGLLMVLVCCQSILAAGIQNGAGNLLRDVLSPAALAAFLRSMVLGPLPGFPVTPTFHLGEKK
jgi:hypothetical protein